MGEHIARDISFRSRNTSCIPKCFTYQSQHQSSAGAKELTKREGGRATGGKGWIEDDFIMIIFWLSFRKKTTGCPKFTSFW